MALLLTQPVKGMSIRNFPFWGGGGGKLGRQARKVVSYTIEPIF
jgi:hypothetical protein